MGGYGQVNQSYLGGVPLPNFAPMAPKVSSENTENPYANKLVQPQTEPQMQPHTYGVPTPTPSPAPAPTPADSNHIFNHYSNGEDDDDDDDDDTPVDNETNAEECKEKLESLDDSIDDIEDTCRGQAINVASLTIMVEDQKNIELADIRRDIKKDADMIAFLKQTQTQQQNNIDNLIDRVDAMKMAVMEMTLNLEICRNSIVNTDFDDAALTAAEQKLMQIMMDLATNTMNVGTLEVSIDTLVMDTDTEKMALENL